MSIRLLIPFYDPTVKDWSLTPRLLRWVTFIWLAIGLLVLFSASYYHGETDQQGDGLYYFNRQVFAVLASLIIFNIIVHLPLKKLLSISHWGLIGMLGLLILTAFTGAGKTTMGATRWIAIGPVQIQPSELIKPFLVLQGAKIFGQWERYPIRVRTFWVGVFALVLLAILKQPNLSTTGLCGMSLWLIAFAGGLPLRYLGGLLITGVVAAGISIALNPYQQDRFSFINPWADPTGSGFHLVQSLMAIGSGGSAGNGFGLSLQKLGYLPIPDTDFIFSVFAEEFGLIGSALLLLMVMSYGTLGLLIALRSNHPVHRLIAIGSMTFIVLQSLINIAVACGVLPTTGLPLPMFSYGGSSMLASLILSALSIRVARESGTAKVIPIDGDFDRR